VAGRSGWRGSIESFGYPAPLYANYWVERVRGAVVDTIPFTGTPRLPNLDWAASLQTPNFQNLSLSTSLLIGRDENFFEWANAHIILGNLDLAWRPTGRLRTELIYEHPAGHPTRRRQHGFADPGTAPQDRIPAVAADLFPVHRAVHIERDRRAPDDSRTGGAILIRDPVTGAFTRTAPAASNGFRVDWLFSYRPDAGHGGLPGLRHQPGEPFAFRFAGLSRVSDGFFVKLSYLFRV